MLVRSKFQTVERHKKGRPPVVTAGDPGALQKLAEAARRVAAEPSTQKREAAEAKALALHRALTGTGPEKASDKPRRMRQGKRLTRRAPTADRTGKTDA